MNYVSDSNYPLIRELTNEDTFAERGGYDYAGVYVWYFIKRYGFKKFLELYKGEFGVTQLIYEGFEKEAIKEIRESILKSCEG